LPTREIYWNIVGHLIMYLFVAAFIGVFAYGVYRRYAVWRLGRSEDRFSGTGRRLWSVIQQALLQRRIAGEWYPGAMHLLLSWGFILLFLGTLIVMLQADLGVETLYGWFYLWFSLVMDLFGALALLGCLMAIYRRYVIRPERLDNTPDDAITLGLILVSLVTGFVLEALRINAAGDPWAAWSPVGLLVARWLSPVSLEAQALTHRWLWWFHMAQGIGFCSYVPYSKLFHVFTTTANQFFRSFKAPGALEPLDLEESETFGVNHASEFTWKQLFDADACTRCGRCQDNCPAHMTQKPLSPKQVNIDLKAHLYGDCLPAALKARRAGKKAAEQAEDGGAALELPPLINSVIGADTLWSCTTCRACEEYCPAFVEHVPRIVDLRRHLVLMEGDFPVEGQKALRNVEKNFNPWGVGWQGRADWAEGLGVKRADEGETADILLWVGCAGAFDDRNKRVARALVGLLQRAGVDFVTLGVQEKCCGDSARRLGNEYLFQMLAAENVENLKAAGAKRIVTACPHCFNTLKNEYPQFGGEFDVVHHAVFLRELVAAGRLRPAGPVGSVTLHDSCYLARYNDIVAPPRELLRAIPKMDLREMARHGRKSLCCGAGGGQMWLEEQGERINELRAGEALATEAGVIAATCPFCLTMLSDGIKAAGREEDVAVRDIAEILAEAVGIGSGQEAAAD